jgi:hypothetical protein
MCIKLDLHIKGRADRLFRTRVLRKLFVPKREQVREDWRKLRSGEHDNLCISDNYRKLKKNGGEGTGSQNTLRTYFTKRKKKN